MRVWRWLSGGAEPALQCGYPYSLLQCRHRCDHAERHNQSGAAATCIMRACPFGFISRLRRVSLALVALTPGFRWQENLKIKAVRDENQRELDASNSALWAAVGALKKSLRGYQRRISAVKAQMMSRDNYLSARVSSLTSGLGRAKVGMGRQLSDMKVRLAVLEKNPGPAGTPGKPGKDGAPGLPGLLPPVGLTPGIRPGLMPGITLLSARITSPSFSWCDKSPINLQQRCRDKPAQTHLGKATGLPRPHCSRRSYLL